MKFKIILGFVLTILIGSSLYAQVHTPVKWQFAARALHGSEVELMFTATLDAGWHIYSQHLSPDGPLPTTFTFQPSPDYSLAGAVHEKSTPLKSYDETFLMDIVWFEGTVVFTQNVKLHTSSTSIQGRIAFMVCNDEMCLPPDEVTFSIPVQQYESVKPIPSKQPIKKLKLPAQADSLPADTSSIAVTVNDFRGDSLGASDNTVVIPVKAPAQHPSLWTIFFGGLLGGFAALFMPCIFPMIPFTVSYFTKQADKSAVGYALLYGLSIILLYVGIGLLITVIFGSDALNALSTHGFFNFFIFLLLIVFAASLLGAFEITLPSSWVNGASEKSDHGGITGIFFMAATLALVSFSCTAPIVGTLLVEATTMKRYIAPAIGMFGFSLALALPFTLFALFPKWLHALPKSGSWLTTFKTTLGFLELALALKFLSNVDLAYHWEWFDREVFLVLWIIIFGMLGFYLLGKVTLAHDKATSSIGTARLFLSVMVLAFTLYMVPGLWGAPLNAISAFLPPAHTQDFNLYTHTLTASTHSNHSGTPRKYDDIFHAPYNLNAFFDYEEGMAYAKKMHKPVMLDFTGHACVNCRRMETVVWSDPRILKMLQDDYVVIQLYVDDKTLLPPSEQTLSSYSGKTIQTIGNKWSDFQASVFKTNSQPWYVLLNPDGRILGTPQGAEFNIDQYKKFLDTGMQAFRDP